MSKRNRLASMILIASVLLAVTWAFAAPIPVPTPGQRFHCSDSNWEWVEFNMSGSGNLIRGTSRIKEVGKPADTKRTDLAYKGGPGWEYTLVREGQCKRTVVIQHRGERIYFSQCEGALAHLEGKSCHR